MNIKTSAISLLTALVMMLTGCAKTEDPSQGSSDSSSAVTESAQGGEDSSTAGDGGFRKFHNREHIGGRHDTFRKDFRCE